LIAWNIIKQPLICRMAFHDIALRGECRRGQQEVKGILAWLDCDSLERKVWGWIDAFPLRANGD
jgi:hypothetical protein